MDKLIWFSIPGAILILPLVLLLPQGFLERDWVVGIILIDIPIIGFIIHQLWRLFFELFGGYTSNNRKVISEIKTKWNLKRKKEKGEKDLAFLVWELTFYSHEFDEAFRSHDRGAWHYIMSFYSCSLASLLGMMIFIFNYMAIKQIVISTYWLLLGVYLLLTILFFWKAILTKASLESQEVGMFRLREGLFEKTLRELKKK